MGFDSLVQDVHYAVRNFRRAPLFAATVVATMGLGLGLLGSAFTLLNAYLGVRMALGASAWRIVRGLLIETFRTASIGLAAGLAVAAGLVVLFSGRVAMPAFGAGPFVVGAAIVLVATAVAALLPLRNAARIDPAQALRAE